MVDFSKRNTLRLAAASAAGVALGTVGAQAAEPLKAAWIYVGPVGDGGWSFAHDNGRKAAQKHFGDKIKTSFVENVPEGADTERVARDLINQGNTLIYATSFGYMNPIFKVAKEFPKVKFEHCTGYKSLPNLRTYEARNYQGAFLAGLVAGAMTKNNHLGYVATVPIPEVLRNLNSFTLGALQTNPKITTKVVWINDWVNPPKEAEAANSLYDAGCDILFQNTDSPAVLKTAESRGKRAFGWDSDMTAYGPHACLGSSIIEWAPYYIHSVGQVLDGTWKTGPDAWWGVKQDTVDLVGIAKDVPADVVAKVDHARAGLKDGSFAIWKGPISDNQGKDVLPAGKVADDDWLRAIKFYVKGVEGKVPGGA